MIREMKIFIKEKKEKKMEMERVYIRINHVTHQVVREKKNCALLN